MNNQFGVSRDDRIVGHQSKWLDDGLSDKNAVERVLVMWWQRLDLCRVSRGDREQQVSRNVKEI